MTKVWSLLILLAIFSFNVMQSQAECPSNTRYILFSSKLRTFLHCMGVLACRNKKSRACYQFTWNINICYCSCILSAALARPHIILPLNTVFHKPTPYLIFTHATGEYVTGLLPS